MTQRKTKIAGKDELLRFYTSVMRGEEEGATVSNRLTAADRLFEHLENENTVQNVLGKLDGLLAELRQAVDEGELTACGDEYDGDETEPFVLEVNGGEDDDEDES